MAVQQVNNLPVTSVSTKNNGGAIKSPSASTDVVRTSHWSIPMDSPGIVGGNNLGQADFGSYSLSVYTGAVSGLGAITGISAASSPYSGLARLNIGNHSFTTGSVVGVKHVPTSLTGHYNGIFRVVATIGTSGVVLNRSFLNTITGIHYATPVGNVGNMIAGNYTMKRLQSNTHGVANSTLASAAADFSNRGHGNFVESIYTSKTAGAVRSGWFNIFEGKFNPDVPVVNDFSSFNTDHATQTDSEGRALLNEVAFNYGAPNPSGADLEAKTG